MMMPLGFLFRSGGALALSVWVVSCGSDDSEPRKEATRAPAPAPAAGRPPAASGPATSEPPAQTQAPPQSRPSATVAYAGELPPLPVTSFPAARPPDVVNAVYEFAARRPDVLRYVPCFCGCERNGHVHNEHCFVSGREADGKPRWDAHGLG